MLHKHDLSIVRNKRRWCTACPYAEPRKKAQAQISDIHDLTRLTMPKLRELAALHNVQINSKMRKPELIGVLSGS